MSCKSLGDSWTTSLKRLMFAIPKGNVCVRNVPLLHWEWKSSIIVSGLMSSQGTFKIHERKSCPVNSSEGMSSTKHRKNLDLVSESKKIIQISFLRKQKSGATCCAWSREQRLLFFLNDSSGFWNWAQQVRRACIDFKRYLNVAQTFFLRMSSIKHANRFLSFCVCVILKQGILRKKKSYSCLSLHWLLTERRDLVAKKIGGWEGLTCPLWWLPTFN